MNHPADRSDRSELRHAASLAADANGLEARHTAAECRSVRCALHRWCIDFNGNLVAATDAPAGAQRAAR